MRLIFGMAAMVLAATPAGAWSPAKREPETKLRECPEVGAGYVRVPGSDTCIKLGGLVRVEGATVRGTR